MIKISQKSQELVLWINGLGDTDFFDRCFFNYLKLLLLHRVACLDYFFDLRNESRNDVLRHITNYQIAFVKNVLQIWKVTFIHTPLRLESVARCKGLILWQLQCLFYDVRTCFRAYRIPPCSFGMFLFRGGNLLECLCRWKVSAHCVPKSPNWETPYCTKLIFSAESFFSMVCFFIKTFFFWILQNMSIVTK